MPVASRGRTWWNSRVDRLLELLRERGFRRGRFRLSSGKESDFFIDCKPAVLSAEGHALVGAALLERIAKLGTPVVAVAGVELGGCPLASAVAARSFSDGTPLDAVYVRKSTKDHGTRKTVEGSDHLPRGAAVVLTEDTVTTGGSTLRAIERLREAGLEVRAVLAIVDRLEGGAQAIRDAGVPFQSLYDRHDFLGTG